MMTRWKWGARVAIATGTLTCAAGDSHAGNLEPAGINLGATSFFDGFGRNEEGFVYLVYGQYGFARSVRDNSGNALPIFNNPKIDVFSLINPLGLRLARAAVRRQRTRWDELPLADRRIRYEFRSAAASPGHSAP